MSCAELFNMHSSVGLGWIHGMMPFDENPKVEGYVDKEIL